MFEKVRKLIALQLKIPEDKITMESRIKDDLGADSVDILQLLMTLEDEHGIEIPDEKLVRFNTVGDIVEYLESCNL
ncbi:MAG: acyl carrier protein [Candidatus Borkfalkiaceae bacterium]|nr:acyl carrier protein [Christensenellaceae bacterium]